MPLLQNYKDWVKWIDDHLQEEDLSDYILEPPNAYPCWILAYIPYSGCYGWSFVYKDKEGNWDLLRYEQDEDMIGE